MSWHFLQGQEVASWPESSLDGAPSALLKLIPTQETSSLPGSGTESLSHFQCGTMSALSTGSNGEGTLTSSRQDFHVRTSARQEKEQGSKTENAPGYGERQQELLARYCRHSRSWKIARCLPIEGLELSCKIWPKWGTMRNGVCSRLKSVDYRTKEPGCSLLPTPLKSDGLTMSRFKASSVYKAVMGGASEQILLHVPYKFRAPIDGDFNYRGDDGLAEAVDRIGCCGNGWVPQVAVRAWQELTARLSA